MVLIDIGTMCSLHSGLIYMLIIMACKLWYFMELNRRAVSHEIKRLELQVSLLAENQTGSVKGTSNALICQLLQFSAAMPVRASPAIAPAR